MSEEKIQAEAWLGDAILELYARKWILQRQGRIDGELCRRMTSNQFLSAFGNPTGLEAQIGRVYQQSGLEAAFGWIEQNLLPLFLRQEEKRARKAGLVLTDRPLPRRLAKETR